ncbi:dynein regulatory complex subunit 2 [Periplaneta americana]|uniref:dynein regulatory complex subunit 2 n=1 Tax=Periplaneta americana TaxID=6978 RepID=UPI0037E83510
MIANTDLVQDKPLPPKPPSKKLTKAEKRAAKKLEEEERKKQLRRDHLQRELRISDYNWKTLKWKFMDMLREMKMPQMQEDALTVWRVFERTIDNKNFAISQLKDCLDEADLQYAINLNQHLEIIDNLIASFIDRMNDMKADFDAECLEITNEASGLRSSIISEQDTSDGQLRAIMIAMERHFETYMTSYVSESNAKVDDEKNKVKPST